MDNIPLGFLYFTAVNVTIFFFFKWNLIILLMFKPKILVGFSEKDYPNVLTFSRLGDCTFKKYNRNYLISNIKCL